MAASFPASTPRTRSSTPAWASHSSKASSKRVPRPRPRWEDRTTKDPTAAEHRLGERQELDASVGCEGGELLDSLYGLGGVGWCSDLVRRRLAAHAGKDRARREDSGTKDDPSLRSSPATRYGADSRRHAAWLAASRMIAAPLSYGTLSHLWRSTAQESARWCPATKLRRDGVAATHKPKAPSTCIHAPYAAHASAMSSNGSKAPVFTLPACAQTIAGVPGTRVASASATTPGRIPPCSSTSTTRTWADPMPRNARERQIVACASAPTITATGGQEASPSRSGSYPALRSTVHRATARQVVLAIWLPVTRPTPLPVGSASRSTSQLATTSSHTAAAGEDTPDAEFWSQADAIQSAPTAAGSEPPVTKPKYRGPAVATRPGSAAATRSSITDAGSAPDSGTGPPKAARNCSRSTGDATVRAGSLSMKACACSAARAVALGRPEPVG